MSKNYKHLSPAQRYQIEALLKAQMNQREIACIIGVSASTVSRELKRNTPQRGKGAKIYWAINAQRRTMVRHKLKPKYYKLDDTLKRYIESKMVKERLSPEFISFQGKEIFNDFVSYETIYKFIWNSKQSHHREDRPYIKLYKYLAHGKRRRKRGNRHDSRGTILNRVSIEKRASIVSKRKRLGDIEVDLMVGKDHRGALLVTLDRSSLQTRIINLKDKTASTVKKALLRLLKRFKYKIRTITFDNDLAFAYHDKVGKIFNAKTYFTRPYTSQDKGSVENRIGIIRRFLPKKTDLLQIETAEIKRIENLLNNRPIRKFNYKSANIVFSEKIALIA